MKQLPATRAQTKSRPLRGGFKLVDAVQAAGAALARAAFAAAFLRLR